MALTEEGGSDRARARLYRAMARLVTDAHDEALLELRQTDGSRLPDQDRELLEAALKLGQNVRKALPVASEKHDVPGAEKTAVRPRIDFRNSVATIDRAQKLLDESEEQLKEKNR
jgi:chemotaxis protein MotC